MKRFLTLVAVAVFGGGLVFVLSSALRSQAAGALSDPAIGLANQVTPVGTIFPFAGDLAVPEVKEMLERGGWRACDGETYDPAALPLLAKVIGTKYDPETDPNKRTHKLPDFRGEFLRGADDRRAPAL